MSQVHKGVLLPTGIFRSVSHSLLINVYLSIYINCHLIGHMGIVMTNEISSYGSS